MHASRFISALAGAVALGAAVGAAQAQTSPPVMTMAPLPASPATPVSAPVPRPGANADTPPPAVPGTAPSAPAGPAGPETSAPLPPVHTMAPRPLPSGGTAPGGTAPGAPNLDPNTVPGSPAMSARALRAHRTAGGYVLSGEAQVQDGCQAARFDPAAQSANPAQFTLVQYRNPANRGVMCTQMVRWVPASRTVTTAKPPAAVTVRTAAGTKRIPVR
ncbi:MAG: hypothetical protein QOI11_2271 [Candidatus Eremiobacteraeota bacterium]|jgi:hypothetical protein|nr:hypothetical protein [Candidatus Eremiobacteraeota bacterium]